MPNPDHAGSGVLMVSPDQTFFDTKFVQFPFESQKFISLVVQYIFSQKNVIKIFREHYCVHLQSFTLGDLKGTVSRDGFWLLMT
jgi:hypothetical protein